MFFFFFLLLLFFSNVNSNVKTPQDIFKNTLSSVDNVDVLWLWAHITVNKVILFMHIGSDCGVRDVITVHAFQHIHINYANSSVQ